MYITIFGAGYVGLVTGACLADVGHQVLCVDIDANKVAQLEEGIVPIYEPGLEELVKHNYREGRLAFTVDSVRGVEFGELLFIAVATPPNGDGSADLRFVTTVAETIGRFISEYRVVINKSTVPVGTADSVRESVAGVLKEREVDVPFDVCSNPEFLKEGAAIDDFTRGARIIVGTDSDRVREKMRECYAPYNRNHDKLMFMDIRSAELTKYAANAMLATKISFINEMANLAERLGADIEDVRQGIGSDPRIGYDFIYAGCGYGGSCFPKDVRALAHSGGKTNYDSALLEAVDQVNEKQKSLLFKKLHYALKGQLEGKTIAVWGLSFKPNTDDMREAPSRMLMESLWAAGARVKAYDPKARNEAERLYGKREDLTLVEHRQEAVAGADALVICTEWKEFRTLDFDWLKEELNYPVVVDGRNLYEPATAVQYGIRYFGVGRGEPVLVDAASI